MKEVNVKVIKLTKYIRQLRTKRGKRHIRILYIFERNKKQMEMKNKVTYIENVDLYRIQNPKTETHSRQNIVKKEYRYFFFSYDE